MLLHVTIVSLLLVAVNCDSGSYILPDEETKDQQWVFCSKPTDGDSIFNYSIDALNSTAGTINFSKFKGKPILLVNVATYCGSAFEYPLYNQLIDKFGDKLALIAFPSNNFANQEPSADPDEIYNAIKYVRPGGGFVPKFPLTVRIDVNGEKRHPIYSFLKRSCPSTRTRIIDQFYLNYREINSRDIRWNFEKFLLHPKTGQPWKRYDQLFTPNVIIPDIEQLLKEN